MQFESKDIYRLTAEVWGLSPDLVKSIGDSGFKELSDLQRNAPDLILNVRHLGRRFCRKTKLIEKLDKLEMDYRDLNDGRSLAYGRTKEDVDQDYTILDRLRERYKLFLDAKYIIKSLRLDYENLQTCPQSDLPSQPVREAGPDNQTECPGVSSGKSQSIRIEDQLP